MADPVWPTEPWYLADNYKLDFGYLVEHFHRIVGLARRRSRTGPHIRGVGRRATTTACVGWASGRWLALSLPFSAFHGVLRMAPVGQEGLARLSNSRNDRIIARRTLVPRTGLRRTVGWAGWSEPWSSLGMMAAMIQGLLGGVRVRLNELAGRELSAIHGTFAGIVFALLMAVAILTRTAEPEARPIARGRGAKLALVDRPLVVFTFAQIALGAWIRHFPESAGQSVTPILRIRRRRVRHPGHQRRRVGPSRPANGSGGLRGS